MPANSIHSSLLCFKPPIQKNTPKQAGETWLVLMCNDVSIRGCILDTAWRSAREVSGAGKAVLTNHKGNVGVVAGAFPPLLLNNTLSAKTLENLALQNFQGFKHQCSLTLHVPAQKASN